VPVSGRLFHTSIFLFLSNFRLVRPSGFFYFHIPLKDLIFMGSTVYAEKLTDPRWQKKRLKVFERDEWACVYCKDTTLTLHVHHEKYEGENPWDTDDDYLKTVCEKCHSFIGFIRAGNVEMITCLHFLSMTKMENLSGLLLIIMGNGCCCLFLPTHM
jgi:hypothetical protein